MIHPMTPGLRKEIEWGSGDMPDLEHIVEKFVEKNVNVALKSAFDDMGISLNRTVSNRFLVQVFSMDNDNFSNSVDLIELLKSEVDGYTRSDGKIAFQETELKARLEGLRDVCNHFLSQYEEDVR